MTVSEQRCTFCGKPIAGRLRWRVTVPIGARYAFTLGLGGCCLKLAHAVRARVEWAG